MSRWLLLLWLFGFTAIAAAQPQVRVETRLTPEAPYRVGSTLRLEVDLLTNTWFTQAPQAADLQMPGVLITPPNGQADKLTVSRDGENYFGLRLTYLLSPLEAQRVNIPALSFSLQVGQASAPYQVNSQPLSFNAEPATGQDHASAPRGITLVAKAVRFSQSIERSATPLKVGDSLTRRLWVEAEGAQGMLIPPAEFATIDGLKSYPLPAEVKPLSDGRGAISGGQRRDALSYIIEQPGSYRLPALQLQWWDATSATLRTSQVPAVEFEAIANTAYHLPFDFSADLQNLSRGQPLKLSTSKLLLGAGALGLLIGLYLARARLRQQYQHWLAWRRARHSAWLASEGYAWNQLQRALKTSAVPLQPLYRWLRRSLGSPQLSALSEHLPAPQAQALRQALAARYAAADKAAPLIDLRSSLRAVRRALRRARKRHAADELLRPLNPQHTGRRAE